MQAHEVIGVVAGGIALLGSVPYIVDTLRGRTRPNRATWMVYALACASAVASSWAAGGTWTLIVPLVFAVGPIAILLASIRHGEGGWSLLDRWCLAGAAAGLIGWWASGDPRVAVWMQIGVEVLGTIPTWRKAWLRPAEENRLAWTIYACGSGLNLFAIQAWTVGEAAFAVWLVLCCSSVAAVLWWRHGATGAGPSRRMG